MRCRRMVRVCRKQKRWPMMESASTWRFQGQHGRPSGHWGSRKMTRGRDQSFARFNRSDFVQRYSLQHDGGAEHYLRSIDNCAGAHDHSESQDLLNHGSIMIQGAQKTHYNIRICAFFRSLSYAFNFSIQNLQSVPIAVGMLMYFALMSVALAESSSERSFSVRVTVTSNRQLEELATASRRAAARRFNDRGIPMLSPEEKRIIRATTPAPTIHFTISEKVIFGKRACSGATFFIDSKINQCLKIDALSLARTYDTWRELISTHACLKKCSGVHDTFVEDIFFKSECKSASDWS